jgi:hypothetical protein
MVLSLTKENVRVTKIENIFGLQRSRGSNPGPHAYYPNPSPLNQIYWLYFILFLIEGF